LQTFPSMYVPSGQEAKQDVPLKYFRVPVEKHDVHDVFAEVEVHVLQGIVQA
jgi:hypothetical protein